MEKKEAMETERPSQPEKETSELNNDEFLTEWVKKICQAVDTVWEELVKLRSFEDEEKEKKFIEEMAGKQFGKFITVFKPGKGSFIYLKVGDCEMGPHYSPSSIYKEKIKSFLERQENSLEVSQEIIMRLVTIPIVARMIRGRILYPEIGKMEKKIAELEGKIKEKNKQLRFALDMWLYLMHEVQSPLRNALPRIHAMINEIEKE